MSDHHYTNRRVYKPHTLTIGDGFRIGFGIAFWVTAFSLAAYAFLFIVLGLLGS